MKQEKRRRLSRQVPDEQLLDAVFRSSSTTDCTGLIPNAIHSHAEQENYNEMYTFLPSATRDEAAEKKGVTDDLPCANGGSVEKSE